MIKMVYPEYSVKNIMNLLGLGAGFLEDVEQCGGNDPPTEIHDILDRVYSESPLWLSYMLHLYTNA